MRALSRRYPEEVGSVRMAVRIAVEYFDNSDFWRFCMPYTHGTF